MELTPVLRIAAATAVMLGAGLSFLAISSPADAEQPVATAVLRDADGDRVGRVRLYNHDGHATVRVRLSANAHVTPSQFHGFHIHANDDPANGAGCVADPAQPANTWFVSADGHLEVDDQTHGDHVGDLPSLVVNPDGSASTSFTDDDLSPGDLGGKVIVLHAGPDNFGNVPIGTAADQYSANSPAATTKTQNTGNAGDRVACGVIEGVNTGEG